MKISVNGQQIDQKIIDEEVDRIRSHYEKYARANKANPSEEQLLEWSSENVIEKVLLKQEAKHQKLSTQKLLKKITKDVEPPSEEEISAFYDNNKMMFTEPEQIRAAHIVKHVNSPEQKTEAFVSISNIQERLKKGETFEKLAAENSDCPDNAGDLGYFKKGQMVQEFEDVVFQMKVGDVSDIFLSPFGYHIVKLNDRKEAGPAPFKEVKQLIRSNLTKDKKNRTIENFVDDLSSKADIVRE